MSNQSQSNPNSTADSSSSDSSNQSSIDIFNSILQSIKESRSKDLTFSTDFHLICFLIDLILKSKDLISTNLSNQSSNLSENLNQNLNFLVLNVSHQVSNLKFQFNLSKLGNKFLIASINLSDDQLFTLDFSIPQFVDPNKLPLDLKHQVLHDSLGFKSKSHLINFISIFSNKILKNLSPNFNPTDPSSSNLSKPSLISSDSPHLFQLPINQSTLPSRNHLEIGRSDLDPIGSSNIHIPSLYNRPNHQPLHPPSGMILGPNHSIFNNHRPNPPPFGGDGFLPPGAVPPGARFDPILPQSSINSNHSTPHLNLDPMGGLSQGLPLANPHPSHSNPYHPNFNDGRPSGYDDMFM
ncbi:hypothetical protein O181_018999 [Austropuccinia psidii MF-1]|uniref:Proteasome inhibitor PI31 subunit n=1 Tax=Austropuccinia psidii MF-1 TaxID=1389203 RepID=A0A9Q3C8Q1_9BASI|nr:hypothetical protein [Austropuccinia psidii MF-1]